MSENKEPSPEEYIIKGSELIWPDPSSMERFTQDARDIIVPFLDYVHSGPEYARDTPQEHESLLLEKAAVDMNRNHKELVVFAWIPGYPQTAVPLLPQLLESELPDLGLPVKEFWDMYRNDDEALSSYQEVVNRAKTWALMRLNCRVANFWDGPDEHLHMVMCLGEPTGKGQDA